MKSSKLIVGCLATLSLTAVAASVQAQVDRDAIAERLRPVGELCLQGEECGTAAASATAAPAAASGAAAGSIDGSAIYTQVCAMCHDTGVAAAPIRGNDDNWAGRIDQGWDTLLDHSINGFNAMPARGGNPNLSDDEVAAATAYLVEPVMDVPELGGEGEEASSEVAPAEEEADVAAVAAEEGATETDADTAADDAAAGDEPAHASIDGEPIYNQACMACHMTGAAGAPLLGNADQWGARLEQGMDTLYDHSINGFGAMPPKGGFMSLSDDEVKAAVDFMIDALD